MDPLIAEAIATLIVLIYNFSAHHLFTYRHVKHA
jgi:putative flippase GtrA